MSQLFEKPLPVGKTGNYTVTVDSGWLGQETISGQTVTVEGGGASVGTVTSANGVIQAFLTGVEVGRHEVEFDWQTATRSDCITTYIDVVEC